MTEFGVSGLSQKPHRVTKSIIIFTCYLCLSSIPWGSTLAESPVVLDIYSLTNSPPYAFEEKGELIGIYPDIVNKAIRLIPEYQINLIPVPWRRGLSFVESGDGFAIIPPYSRPSTRPYIDPYSVSILKEEITVFCNQEIEKINKYSNWPQDFIKLNIGINSGYSIGGNEFWSYVKHGKIKIQQSETSTRNIQRLEKRRIDCFLTDKLSFLYTVENLIKNDQLPSYFTVKQGPSISQEYGFIGFSADGKRFPFKQHFVQSINQVLTDMKNNGEIENIIDSYVQQTITLIDE